MKETTSKESKNKNYSWIKRYLKAMGAEFTGVSVEDPTGAKTAEKEKSSWIKRYLKAMGPGLVTGAADDDPSGIATYSQAGAGFGLSLLWTTLITFPLMAAVQEISDRTALATGKSLGKLILERFPKRGKPILAILLLGMGITNVVSVAGDLGAAGSGMSMLGLGPSWIWAAAGGIGILLVLLLGSFPLVAKVFKLLAMSLLSYLVVLFLSKPNWIEVFNNTFVPNVSLNPQYISMLVAVLGTTISGYLFFWQSGHRIEELRQEPTGGPKAVSLDELPKAKKKVKQTFARLDVISGMAFSNLVMFAIIASTADTIGRHKSVNIQTATQAAQALRPFAGQFASVLFALGFIGTAMLAIPVLAGSVALASSDLLEKSWGFSKKVKEAPVFYGLVALGTLGGTFLSISGFALMKLLVLVATINGLIDPPFLIILMLVSNSQTIMGDQKNGRIANYLGWITTILMTGAAITLLVTS